MRKALVIVFLFVCILLSGCKQSSEKKIDSQAAAALKKIEAIARQSAEKSRTSDEKATAKEAYRALKSTISEKTAGKNVRLGKISGTRVDKDGRGSTWAFVYYADNTDNKNYTHEYGFGWVKGKISTGYENIFSLGLNTTAYDYMFKDIGSDWLDSKEIARKAYGLFTKTNMYGIQLQARWDTSKYKTGPFWLADAGLMGRENPDIYFDAQSGEKIK